jgi:hypothetical protein
MKYFSNQKSKFWRIFDRLGMEHCGIFHLKSVSFVAIWYVLWPFGIFCDRLVEFFRFGILYNGKSGNPGGPD